MPSVRDSTWVVVCTAAVLFASYIVFPLFDAYETVTVRPPPANTTVPFVSLLVPNATALALTCLQQCGGTGGVCEQDPFSGATTCVVCAPNTSLDPDSGFCRNTIECDTWPWCSTAEAGPLQTAHVALVATAYLGPGPTNYTYPVTNLSSVAPFVPLLGISTTAVVDLLNAYLLGRRTLGPASGVGVYWDDQLGSWGSDLAVYKSIVPSVFVDYVLALKTRRCTRVWRPLNGTCLPPSLV